MRSTVEMSNRSGAVQSGRCPECESQALVTDNGSGEVVCSACGLVIREVMLDRQPEWRAFTREERMAKSRVGSPTSLTLFDKGLSTTFQPDKDANGRLLPIPKRITMTRLRKWQIRARTHSHALRNLLRATYELTRLSDRLRIPMDVEETAALIYRKALDEGLIRGRSIQGVAAASLYAACRLTRTPRNLKAIVGAGTMDRKTVARYYRLILRTLNLTMPSDDPTQYVAQIASKVQLSPKTQTIATQLLQRAKARQVMAGKGPIGLAATALYIASIMNGERIIQKKIAKMAGTTEVTLRHLYKGLVTSLELGLIPAV